MNEDNRQAQEAEQYRRDKDAAELDTKPPAQRSRTREIPPPGGACCCHWGRSPYWDRMCAWCRAHIADGSLVASLA